MNLISQLKNAKKVLNQAARNSSLLEELDDVRLRKVQAELLLMYRDIKAACEKYDIPVILTGGSALGAVRHKGYIPWDDDLDLAMARQDYDRFCRIFEKELGEKYILNAPNYCKNAKNRYPMVLKKDSYFENIVDVKDPGLHKLFVDVFIIDNVPDNKARRFLKGRFCELLHFISGQVYVFECRDKDMKEFFCSAGKGYYYTRMAIGGCFSFLRASKWFDLIDRHSRYDGSNTRYVGAVTGRKHYFGEMLKREEYFPYSEGEFEGEKVLLHHDTDKYLTLLYGDYMKVPEPEDRERHFVYKIKI